MAGMRKENAKLREEGSRLNARMGKLEAAVP
jgi:hypothetical protein